MIVDTRPMSLAEQERLVKLMQECAEVILAASKAWMYGWAPAHAGVHYDNRADLEEELGDVNNVYQLMVDRGDINPFQISQSSGVKWPKMMAHMRHQHWEERPELPPEVDEEADCVVGHVHGD